MARRGSTLRTKTFKASPFIAEFLGTFVFVFLSSSVLFQQIYGGDKGKNMHVLNSFAYGLALMVGIFICGGLSGGHLNPAVTLSFSIYRRFSVLRAIVYFLLQVVAAFLACYLAYLIYLPAIRSVLISKSQLEFEDPAQGIEFAKLLNGTATSTMMQRNLDRIANLDSYRPYINTSCTSKGNIFGFPGSFLYIISNLCLSDIPFKLRGGSVMDTTQSTATAAAAATRYFNYVFSKGDFLHAFISELVGSCIFVIAVFAITDIKNVSMRHTAPIAIGMSYAGCKLIFGFTDYGGSFNPILDIAFRTLTWMVFGSLDILKKTTIFMVASIVGSFLGGFIGASIYELLTWSNQEYRTKVGDK